MACFGDDKIRQTAMLSPGRPIPYIINNNQQVVYLLHIHTDGRPIPGRSDDRGL